MDTSGINEKNLEALLKIVSDKLKVPPAELKSQLQSGKFDKAVANMNKNEADMFRKVMSNPKLAEKLMSAPQAQALYKKIMGGK